MIFNDHTDPKVLRSCFGRFATGVTVVTACCGEDLIGLTVNSFASVSLTPPLVLWSIRNESPSLPLLHEAQAFAINILAADQTEIALAFARPGSKFAQIRWTSGLHNSPLLEGVCASFECTTFAEYDGGDHTIIVGQVRRATEFDIEPLVFSRGRFGNWIDQFYSGPNESGMFGLDGRPDLLSTMMLKSFHALASLSVDARTRLGLDLVDARVLYTVAMNPNHQIDDLLGTLLMDANTAHSICSKLISQGLLKGESKGVLHISEEGFNRMSQLVQEADENEQRILAQFPSEDVKITRRVVSKLAQNAAK